MLRTDYIQIWISVVEVFRNQLFDDFNALGVLQMFGAGNFIILF